MLFEIIFCCFICKIFCAGNTWNRLQNDGSSNGFPPRHSHVAVVLKDGSTDKTFVYGGRNEVLNLKDLYSFDDASKQWQKKADGKYRKDACAAAINQGTQMLVFGGTGGAIEGDTALDSLDVFTPASNAWAQLSASNGPSARSAHSCVVYKNKFYVFGGLNNAGQRLNELWAYELGKNTWEQLNHGGAVPGAISGHSATVFNNEMIVFGGFRQSQFELREVRRLDLDSLTWSELIAPTSTKQPLAREKHVAIPIDENSLLIFGGLSNGYFLNDIWIFDTIRNYWFPLPEANGVPSTRGGSASTLINNKMVLFGGTTGNPTNDVYSFTFPTCQPKCNNFGGCDGISCDCSGTGYTGSTCSTPTCAPACQNGGECVAPNVCDCSAAQRQGKMVYGDQCQNYCGDGTVQAEFEECDDADTSIMGCCESCRPALPTKICRPSAGICDVAETCGGAFQCPPDLFKDSLTICRDKNGTCDVPERCSSSSAACPSDQFAPFGTVCRPAIVSNQCDVQETCSGNSADCPPDMFLPRDSSCDNGNNCTVGDTCNDNGICTAGNSICNCMSAAACDDGNPCTKDECINMKCEHSAGNAGATCRAQNGPCDVEEQCDGISPFCPRDEVADFGVVCRGSKGDCDQPELCDGIRKTCEEDQKSKAVCRPSAGICDIVEICDGINDDCPVDKFKTNSTICRPSKGPCDVEESCPGDGPLCKADTLLTNIPCDDNDPCTNNTMCTAGGRCRGDRITPCAQIIQTPAPTAAPGEPTPMPVTNPLTACYRVRSDCELCTQLVDCGYCATHQGQAGACNPKDVKDSCLAIGGTWNQPCDMLDVAAPTPVPPPLPPGVTIAPTPLPPATPSPTPPIQTVTPRQTITNATTTTVAPQNTGVLGTVDNDGPLGWGIGSIYGMPLDILIVVAIVVVCGICCCGCFMYGMRIQKARRTARRGY